jgi:hypothetical protein
MAELVLREFSARDEEQYAAEFWTEWYCEPPAADLTFQVIREEWDSDATLPVRKIYEVRLTGEHSA